MYAVILNEGKQYPVREGMLLQVDKIQDEVGSSIEFNKLLILESEAGEVQVGAPYLEGAKVQAVVVKHFRDKKIRIIKMKSRKHHDRMTGHRQWYTEVKIVKINAE